MNPNQDGYVFITDSGRYWLSDGKGSTVDKSGAAIYKFKDIERYLKMHHTLIFIPITKEKTMNYLEAVKILVNDPKAVAITFTGHSENRRIEIETKTQLGYPPYKLLVFPATATKRKQNVVATCVDFLLREDFSIEYKEEKKYTNVDLQRAYKEGYAHGSKESAAFAKFKSSMEELLRTNR